MLQKMRRLQDGLVATIDRERVTPVRSVSSSRYPATYDRVAGRWESRGSVVLTCVLGRRTAALMVCSCLLAQARPQISRENRLIHDSG
jgi:hypothetical protein